MHTPVLIFCLIAAIMVGLILVQVNKKPPPPQDPWDSDADPWEKDDTKWKP